MSRAERRRAAFAMAKDAILIHKAQIIATPPRVYQVTMPDLQTVLDTNPFFRQELINVIMRREAAAQQPVVDGPPSITVEDSQPLDVSAN